MKQPQFPNEWSLVQIEDILTIQDDGKIIHQGWSPQCEREPASENEWGVLKTNEIQDGFFLDNEHKKLPDTKTPKPRLEVKAGDLLVTNAGPRSRCGIICLVKHTRNKLMISGKMYRLRLPEQFILPNFIEAWLRTSFAQNELNNRKTGISESGLNMTQSRFSTLPVPLIPFAEQKIIAEKLDTLLAQVDSTKARLEQIPQILKRFRQAVLKMAVKGDLTKKWRDKNNILANSWVNPKASDICTKVQSGSTPTNNPFEQNGKIPFLKVYNIVNQKIDFDYKPQFITDEIHRSKSKRSIAFPDDVLMNIVGPPLGKIAILTDQYPEWNLNQAITLFRVEKEKMLSKFLYYVLCEGKLVRDVMHDTKGIVGQINISLTQCREAVIPCPSLPEQVEIVRRVEQLFAYADTVENQVHSALTRVNNLTQSILAKAFRGELTAQWRAENPNLISGENSAAALLEKIKAERAASGGKKASRKKT